MVLAQEVKYFAAACKYILSAISRDRPPTQEEAATIEGSCKEVLAKIATVMKRE